MAAEQLGLGLSVVIDACNAHDDARAMWADMAARFGARLAVIECACADEAVHKARVAARVRAIAHFPEVTWDEVEAARARYRPWPGPRLRLDTSAEAPEKLVAQALRFVRGAIGDAPSP
ncbi:MAG: AAA family ATPase [Caulobacteraceae bacterium]